MCKTMYDLDIDVACHSEDDETIFVKTLVTCPKCGTLMFGPNFIVCIKELSEEEINESMVEEIIQKEFART